MRYTAYFAYEDIISAFKCWRIWLLLGWQDIRLRYRRSLLGPWWITLSMLVTILCLGFLYGNLFKLPLADYLPYLAIGMVIWAFILALINEGSNVFVESAPYLKQISLPYSIFLLRVLVRNTIIFFHNLIPAILVLFFFQTELSWALLSLPLGIFIILVNGFCFGWIFGLLGARYRDMQPIIGSMMQVAFFVTPIIWSPAVLPERYQFLVNYNPFAQYLALIRQPLLGEWPSIHAWVIPLAITAIGLILMWVLINRMRKRIIYWL